MSPLGVCCAGIASQNAARRAGLAWTPDGPGFTRFFADVFICPFLPAKWRTATGRILK
jgi:hypothetical protein